MNLPKNAIDEIQNYDLSSIKQFADLQKKYIEIDTLMLQAIKQLQMKFDDLGDQVVLDQVITRFKLIEEKNKKNQFALMSLACYTTEGLYDVMKNLGEIKNASDAIFERHQNRTESETAPVTNE